MCNPSKNSKIRHLRVKSVAPCLWRVMQKIVYTNASIPKRCMTTKESHIGQGTPRTEKVLYNRGRCSHALH